jgi:hypothetical protein
MTLPEVADLADQLWFVVLRWCRCFHDRVVVRIDGHSSTPLIGSPERPYQEIRNRIGAIYCSSLPRSAFGHTQASLLGFPQ